ncbi:MAG: AMP-binding protein, partial [Burkholderiales bacterium]
MSNSDVLHIGIHAEQRPDQPAIIMAATSQVVTYRELNDRSKKLALYLRANGVKAGEHVAIQMRNNADYFVACWAARRSGLYFTPVNWHLTPEEVTYIVEDCDAKVLVTSEAEVPVAEQVVAKLPQLVVRLTNGPATGSFKSLQ